MIKFSSPFIITHSPFPYYLIHDSLEQEKIEQKFRDAFLIFQTRIRKLGNLNQSLSYEERQALEVMLLALLETRKLLHRKNEPLDFSSENVIM